MIQTGLIQNTHNDLVTDVAYDYYGLRLATCSLDQRIKIWQLDERDGTWSVEDDWKAHDAAITKLSWAHPEFGSLIASSSFDRTVKIWAQTSFVPSTDAHQINANTASGQGGTSSPPVPSSQLSNSRWVERAVLVEAKGTVRAVEFAPHHFGLKFASISTDNYLRIYECLEQPSQSTWQISEEIEIQHLPNAPSPALHSHLHSAALATPTQMHAGLDSASVSLVAQALQQGLQQSPQNRSSSTNREADGGWCISWCKDKYWGELIAVGCGTSGVIKIIQLSPPRSSAALLTLSLPHTPAVEGNTATLVAGPTSTDTESASIPSSITSVAWAPSCGRSYHLIATGGRDGRVRIWRVKPAADDDHDDLPKDDARWTATVVADFDHHKSTVGRVEWNITGTVLSSAGNDGRIRLWKATSSNVWRPAGSIGIEQTEDHDDHSPAGYRDVEMDGNTGFGISRNRHTTAVKGSV